MRKSTDSGVGGAGVHRRAAHETEASADSEILRDSSNEGVADELEALELTSSSESAPNQRKSGRPSRGEGPRYPAEELDRLLVHGEKTLHKETGLHAQRFPTHRELAERFGVSHTTIDAFAIKHNCEARRTEAAARIRAKADDQLVALRAHQLALTVADLGLAVDKTVLTFVGDLMEGKIRCNSVSEFIQVAKFKLVLEGHADSRTEVNLGVSLDAMQARYRDARQRTHTFLEAGAIEAATLPVEMGEVVPAS